jgi:hypothetical protein
VSIKPPSDLLLDVVRAADPATSAAATERLAKIAASGGKSDAVFSTVLNEVGTPSAHPMNPTGLATQAPPSRFSKPPVDANKKAYQGLEALLLQNLVETMLPQDSDLFGGEGAGTIWRSMLAEQLGTSLSKKVDLGIAPKYLHLGHRARQVVADGGAAPPLDEILHVVPKQT